ncbi:MAG: class I SAM-dependent methyltransferase [Acidobacteriota bacterium]
MSLYERYVLPHLIHVACGNSAIAKQRQKVVPLASGRVLEIGMGSGLNLPFYDRQKVEKVWGLEPSLGMRKKAARRVRESDLDLEWLDLPGEEIPLEDDSVDTVVLTYTLCTIPGWEPALEQMRRVLKPGGRMVFAEHGEAPDDGVRRWQQRIEPMWKRIAGGCHLSRPIPRFLEQGGFALDGLETMYLPGPKWASFNYWGQARAR